MKELHIISFNYPYPPSYGGIIDVYYKVKALSELGIRIHLHCFVDIIPTQIDSEIKDITENVFFYKKRKNPLLYFSSVPFAAAIRNSNALHDKLAAIKAPILFEGLQTTQILDQLKSKGNQRYLRLHNNEAEYYKGLASSEKNFLKRLIYKIEARKYKGYQDKRLKEFKNVFCLSEKEYMEVQNHSQNAKLVHIFHGNQSVRTLSPKGDYFLFHGDLSISDNKKALDETIDLFKGFPEYKLVVASDRASEDTRRKIDPIGNISLVPIETTENLHHLFENAHANILLSYQKSGTKVKLFNALYNSRHIIINENITDDDSLVNLCLLGSNTQEIRQHIIEVAEKDYNGNESRKAILEKNHSDAAKAEEVMKTIFTDY